MRGTLTTRARELEPVIVAGFSVKYNVSCVESKTMERGTLV